MLRLRTIRLALVLVLASLALAQQNAPHIAYVYPAGGRQGTTFEVTVAGQFLDGARDAYVTGGDVKAEVARFYKPMPSVELNNLRDQMKQLQDKRRSGAWTADDEKTATDLRQKVGMTVKRRQTPAIAETVTVRVTIAPDAAIGERELRIVGKAGLTNPLVFCVDQLPEFSRPPAAEAPITADEFRQIRDRQSKPVHQESPADVSLPVIVNGAIMPGGVDRYRFHARKGQRLVFAAKTRELIPYISDAVPGWFQAAISLYDSKGSELAQADHYRFQQDPVIFYEVPEDGNYILQVRDSVYRGREDFVYRISMGELPFVTGTFPLGGKAGSRTHIELTGWNLPVTKTNVAIKQAGVHTFSVREGDWSSDALLFDSDTLPEINSNGRNHSMTHAQSVKLPVVVNGKIEHPDEWHIFRFEARAGDQIVAEVFARRLESPLDSILKLTDAKGRQLAQNDDFDDRAAALITHQADSRISLKIPATGTYYLHLGDAQHRSGSEYGYRFKIGYAHRDFELRVVPSSISLHPAMTLAVTVYALRRDGFDGDIVVKLKNGPSGMVLSGGLVPAGQDSVRVTLGAPANNIDTPQNISFEGEAMINGRKVRHESVPADNMEQAFAYHHLVVAKSGLVAVTGPSRRRNSPWTLSTDKPVKIPAGGTAQLRLHLPFGPFANQAASRLHLALNSAPEGISIDDVSVQNDGLILRLRSEAGKIKPGLRSNLIVDVAVDMPPRSADDKQGKPRSMPIGVLPAIPFEITEP